MQSIDVWKMQRSPPNLFPLSQWPRRIVPWKVGTVEECAQEVPLLLRLRTKACISCLYSVRKCDVYFAHRAWEFDVGNLLQKVYEDSSMEGQEV